MDPLDEQLKRVDELDKRELKVLYMRLVQAGRRFDARVPQHRIHAFGKQLPTPTSQRHPSKRG